MKNHYGRNLLQARINALSVNSETSDKGILKIAAQITETGVGLVAINRSQRRFEERKKRKSQ